MTLPKFVTKEVYIRLEGGEAFVSTVKYGSFYSKTKKFKVRSEATALSLQTSIQPSITHFVPPLTMPPGKQGA